MSTASAVDDDVCMLAFQQGDSNSFERLVERHEAFAWRVAFGFFGDEYLAKDALQNAFLRIYIHAAKYTLRGKFTAFLKQIVIRQCLNMSRGNKPNLIADAGYVVDPRTSPSMKVARSQRWQAVREAIVSLPPIQKLALSLRYMGGQIYQEIASALGLTPKAVECLLWRARKALTPRLEGILE